MDNDAIVRIEKSASVARPLAPLYAAAVTLELRQRVQRKSPKKTTSSGTTANVQIATYQSLTKPNTKPLRPMPMP